MKLVLPENISFVLDRLTKEGFAAYIVGGCVRDTLMGNEPHDYDITTSALPEQTKAVFSDFPLVLSGMKHGTVAVIINHEMIEITTYRIDGEYADCRHPEQVTFTDRITDDLSRRDFTMNAIAMDMDGNIVDPYFGKADIERGLIRCVGEPDVRFSEDALRILRALRFSSVLGFNIDGATSAGVHKNRLLLQNISCERIFSEISKFLIGKNASNVITEYRDVLNIRFFCGSLSEKIHETEPDLALRIALCLYDADNADDILTSLRTSNALHDEVLTIITYSKSIPREKADIRRAIGIIGADVLIKAASLAKVAENCDTDEIVSYIDFVSEHNLPCKLSDLNINGNDLLLLGVKGRAVGHVLALLLEKCLNDDLSNEHDVLLSFAEKLISDT